MRNEVIDKLAAEGNTFTFEEAQKILPTSYPVTKMILSRLEKNGYIERIEKGKYMIIPLGAKKGEYTLDEFVIGSLLVKPHCISYWSALHFYGMTEQIPNTVYIQTTSRKKNRSLEIFGVDYKVIRIKPDKFFGIRKEWIDENEVKITEREKAIVDCLDKPHYCGGIVEVAKALKTKDFDKERLVRYAEKIGNTGVIRRLGYLSDLLQIDIPVEKVDTRNYLYLDPTMPKKGKRSSKWRLIVNLDDKVLGELE
ncbi:MAG: type IV toxin-antitoxin system AbiEi family antitoxin [Candidatus Saliniplasma sp.]